MREWEAAADQGHSCCRPPKDEATCCQTRSQVFSFGGAKYILRGQDFCFDCFYYMFKTKKQISQKNFGGNVPGLLLAWVAL